MGLSHIYDIVNPLGFQAAEIGQVPTTASNGSYRQCLEELKALRVIKV